MRTQLMIMAIVGVIFVAAVAIVVGLVWWLGWMGGLALSLGIFGLLAVLYFWIVKPWHMRWGATEEERSIVSVLEDGSTSWCLALYPAATGGARLVSRWRPNFDVTPATVAMIALTEPGTFIMEQKMLRTIRDRVEMSLVAPPSPA